MAHMSTTSLDSMSYHLSATEVIQMEYIAEQRAREIAHELLEDRDRRDGLWRVQEGEDCEVQNAQESRPPKKKKDVKGLIAYFYKRK